MKKVKVWKVKVNLVSKEDLKDVPSVSSYMLLFLVFVEKKVAVAIIELAPVPGYKKRINGMVRFFKLFEQRKSASLQMI